jgi:hypothetical protein
MKKTLAFISTLSALISIQPVFAVDYVACREMLRTKNEMLINGRDEENNLFYTLGQDNCPDAKFPKKVNLGWGQSYTDVDYEKQRLCKDETISLYKQTHKPLLQLKTSILLPERETPYSEFYNLNAVKWIKSSMQVMIDMKKASCPYE